MRCGLACVVALLILVPAAAGATPVVSIQATPVAGTAPLHVSFAATGDAAAYRWNFGDGTSAEGRVAEHTYAAGRWTATLTAQSATGETSTQTASVTAYGLTLAGPNPARYGRRVAFRGAIVPAEKGLAVALAGPRGTVAAAKTDAGGRYTVSARVKLPGEYVATSERAKSAPLALRVVPKLVTGLAGSGVRA
ncbi:MAG: PKD domain-containing protein, partial [Gaiellaceae bacterium]